LLQAYCTHPNWNRSSQAASCPTCGIFR
jgi:hypothetical protein